MAAKIGLGIVVAYESATPGTYTAVGEVYDVTPPEKTMETVDATNHSHTDGVRRKIAGLIDSGTASFQVAFDPALTVYAAINTILDARAVKNWKFTYPGGANTILPALVVGLGREVPLDDKMVITVSLEGAAPSTEAAS